MAKTLQNTTRTSMIIPLIVNFFIILLFFFSALVTADNPSFSKTLSPKKLGLHYKREKLSHLRFYFHEVVSGKSPSAIKVADAPTTNSSPTAFGAVIVVDDPLTTGPDPASERVGSAQGVYALASQSELGLLMAFNFVFTAGKFNGSTLSVLGRNAVFSAEREMPVVGGSGAFRFAKGFAKARTYMFNTTTFDAIVEYNVYVFHYWSYCSLLLYIWVFHERDCFFFSFFLA